MSHFEQVATDAFAELAHSDEFIVVCHGPRGNLDLYIGVSETRIRYTITLMDLIDTPEPDILVRAIVKKCLNQLRGEEDEKA